MKRKKIGYQTGMISLLGISLMLLFFRHYKSNKKEVVIQVQMPYPENYTVEGNSNWLFTFENCILNDGIIYDEIEMTGNDDYDTIGLIYAEAKVQKLIQRSSQSKGFCIRFSNESKYWTLVEALDICLRNNVRVFALAKDCLWMKNPKIKNEDATVVLPPSIQCGTITFNDTLKSSKDSTPIITLTRFFQENKIISIVFTFLLFILVVMAFVNIIKQIIPVFSPAKFSYLFKFKETKPKK